MVHYFLTLALLRIQNNFQLAYIEELRDQNSVQVSDLCCLALSAVCMLQGKDNDILLERQNKYRKRIDHLVSMVSLA